MYPRMPARSSGSSTRDLGITPTSPSGATRTWWVIVAIFLIASEIRSRTRRGASEEENPSDADELVAASLPDLGDGCAFLQAVDEAGETSEDVLVVEEVFGDDGVGGDGWEGGRDDEWCDDVEFVPFRTLAEAWL
mmetsp:Transcript_41603/g.126153  ORF Transcript_41603/g.126153 Transcript_41603/m.126153 type:complete len:135 (-) Transcript_41603:246-650(-)